MITNKTRLVIEYDTEKGIERYILPISNALALIPIICNTYQSVIVYSYDNYQLHRCNIRN